MIGGSFDTNTEELTLEFSEPVRSTGVVGLAMSVAGSASGTRFTDAVGAFSPRTMVVFGTTGGKLAGSNVVVTASGAISTIRSVSGNLSVAPFADLVLPAVS